MSASRFMDMRKVGIHGIDEVNLRCRGKESVVNGKSAFDGQ